MELSGFNFLKIYFENRSNNNFFIRILVYILISIIFYNFMQLNSPLGIEWRPHHYERVLNAIRNILENPRLAILGFTSFDSVEEVSKHLENNTEDIYLVQTIPYFIHSIIYKIFPNYNLIKFGSFLDFTLISIIGFLTAEIGIYILPLINLFESIFYGSILFMIFITSPWAYRMMLEPWSQVAFLFFYLFSIFWFIKNKKIIGLISLTIAGLFNWIYSLFLFLFFILIKLINIFFKRFNHFDNTYKFLPNCLDNKNGYVLYTLCCLFPILIRGFQYKLATFMNISHSGSSPLIRIGIDSYENIHHGGLLAAMQFLGGNRFNLCFESPIGLAKIEDYIKIFNCSTSIISLIFLSSLSIISLIPLLNNSNKGKWIITPLTWSFFLDFALFQQSFATHLKGHSFIFAFIFSISLIYFLIYIEEKLKISRTIQILINIPLITGILINSIRVSYLTGING